MKLACLFGTDTVAEVWRNVRGNYRRAMKKINGWSRQPSGSAKQLKGKPCIYKYAAELHFLDESFNLEETSDSFVGSDSVDSDGETGQAYVKSQIQVTEVL